MDEHLLSDPVAWVNVTAMVIILYVIAWVAMQVLTKSTPSNKEATA